MALGRSWNGKLFMMIDRVAGMMNAAPTPITARATISCDGSSTWLATQDGQAEDHEAELQRALAAEPVAEGTGGQQDAGEDEGVGVDDPLQLGARGAEALLDARDGDVQRADRHHDHHEADAERARGSASAGGRRPDRCRSVSRRSSHRRTLQAVAGRAGRRPLRAMSA